MNIYQKSINTARVIAATAITNAGSGHTGVSLGAAAIMFSLFKDHLMFNPKNPNFENRDRFVLSAGHAAPLYYTILHMFGYGISTADLKNFRKYGSATPGHPEYLITPGVEVSTGPLGQGVANAVGLAIAQKYQGHKFNTINMTLFDNYTYCLASDGDLMEGVACEAISLAGTLGLNKLILLYDYNKITIDGDLKLANAENVRKKFKAQNWNVIEVYKGHNYRSINRAIQQAKKSASKPTIIIFHTKIGYGSEKEGLKDIHSAILNREELNKFKESLMINNEDFEIDEDVLNFCRSTLEKNIPIYERWQENFFLFEKTYPELFKVYQQFVLPRKIDFSRIAKNILKEGNLSGRDTNRIVINEIAQRTSSFIGGTADLVSSVRAYIDSSSDMSRENNAGRNIHYGVREHAMGAISNGIALYSSFTVFCSTFLAFSNYMIPAIRMSAMMGLPVLFLFTHDSLLIGEDGPTHQPVEQLTQLRAIPDLYVMRPADVNELLACYDIAINSGKTNCFILTKNNFKTIPSSFQHAKKGGYVLVSDNGKIDIAILSSGIEIPLALEVKKILNEQELKVSISSFPCLEQFERQNANYKKTVTAITSKIQVVIESSNDNIWYKYVGPNGLIITNNRYGKSGNGRVVYERYGFNVKDITKKILEMYAGVEKKK